MTYGNSQDDLEVRLSMALIIELVVTKYELARVRGFVRDEARSYALDTFDTLAANALMSERERATMNKLRESLDQRLQDL